MKKHNDLPVRELKVDEFGIDAIALVGDPAIEIDFLKFKKDKKILLAKVDEDKRIISGPALVPDKMIFRIDEKTKEEYYVYFSKETVAEISQTYLIKGKNDSTNIEHEVAVEDISIIESWIVEDSEFDKSAKLGFSLPVGTWFVSMKVNNDEVWDELVKKDLVKGFSIEGSFIQQFSKKKITEDEKLLIEIEEILNILEK